MQTQSPTYLMMLKRLALILLGRFGKGESDADIVGEIERLLATGDYNGSDGKSAYDLYREEGGTLTQTAWLDSLQGRDGKDGTTQIPPLYAESEAWLAANGETDKLYILPDGRIFAYFEKEGTTLYTNLLPTADTATRISADAAGLDAAVKDGYFEGYRVSTTAGEVKSGAGQCASGFIPCAYGDIIRIQATEPYVQATNTQAIAFYDSNHNFIGANSVVSAVGGNTVDAANGSITLDTSEYVLGNSASLENCAYFRFGVAQDFTTLIVTVNQEIVEGGTEGGTGWNDTGRTFVPADYEDRILELEKLVSALINNSGAIQPTGTIDTDYLRSWEAPIYDADIPVFETDAVKPAKTDTEHTPENAYALYDDLLARYPQYITKTDLGLCSDGVHHLYRYDFQMPETYHTGSLYSEKKCKAFLMSGIHNEYIAVYGLFYALEELVSNPDLRALLRNVHLIVLPCANPYAMVQSNNTIYLNANGVEIHRNFEVGWVPYDEEGGKQYSGAEPLTEPESIAIDNIMKTNKDLAFVLSAHTFGERTDGKVMWCSAGTKYTCNLATRIINKLSDSWIARFGDELLPGIESYAPENYANGDYRMGYVSISGTGGSEYRQAAKYGIQGFNFEVASVFAPHGTTANKEPAYSSFGISRYAEVYANVLLTAFGVYDARDREAYCRYAN